MWKSLLFPETAVTNKRQLISIRPIYVISFAFAFGIWIASIVSISFITFLFVTSIFMCISFFFINSRIFFMFILIIFILIGMIYGSESYRFAKNDIAIAALDGRVSLEGKVISTPEVTIKGKKETTSFVLETHHFFKKGTVFKSRGQVQVFLHNIGRHIYFGDTIRIRGSFEAPKAVRNPHSFDYGRYLRGNGIHKIFRGIGKRALTRQIHRQDNSILSHLHYLRQSLKEKLDTLFPSPHAELANALLFGFKKNIPRDIKDAFIKTGTAHLLAISGLNITLIGGFFYFLIGFCGIPRFINLIITIVLIATYTVLAGADPPVLRAGIMGIVILAGLVMEQERNIKSALFFAFLLILTIDPKALFLASFQLSFIATASLVFILPIFERILFSRIKTKGIYLKPTIQTHLTRQMSQIFMTSFSVTVGMFPCLIWYFNQFSFVSFLANALAIPICTFGIIATLAVLLIDLIAPTLSHTLVLIPVALLDLELKIVEWFARIPIGYFYLPKPNWIFFLCYYSSLGIWIFLSHRSRFPTLKKWSFFSFIATLVIFLAFSGPEKSRFLFFDLGKTDSMFLSLSNGSRFLINTGRHFPNDHAYWIIKPYLMAEGIQKLDGLLITQSDAAHAGGFHSLIKYVSINKVLVPGNSKSKYISSYFKPTTLSEGDRIQMGSHPEIYIDVLIVEKGKIGATLISDEKVKILYISSNREEVFRRLMNHASVAYDLVFLPHHDLGVSNAEKDFLRNLSTRYLIINQRTELGAIQNEISALSGATILYLEELGAIQFSLKRKIEITTFFEPNQSIFPPY